MVDDVAIAVNRSENDLWTTAVVCHDADQDEDGEPIGDPTETALLRTAQGAGVDKEAFTDVDTVGAVGMPDPSRDSALTPARGFVWPFPARVRNRA